MWLPLLVACAADPVDDTLLDPTFGERLREGYHCGDGWLVAHDGAYTVRVQADLPVIEPSDPDTDRTVPLGPEGRTLQVYVGSCLSTPGCTDDLQGPPGCTLQAIDHVYDAAGGDASLLLHPDGSISGVVRDLVLVGQDGEPAVAVDELVLPEMPRWTEGQ